VGSGARSGDGGLPDGGAPTPAGGAPATNQSWGSFGTYGNWAQAFGDVHGRAPNIQDAADFWDSQIFLAEEGRPPQDWEWEKRYWTGNWHGDYSPFPVHGPDARSVNFYDRMLDADNSPEWMREGFKQWVRELPNKPDAPEWLRAYASDALAVWSDAVAVATPAGSISPTNLPAYQVQVPDTPPGQSAVSVPGQVVANGAWVPTIDTSGMEASGGAGVSPMPRGPFTPPPYVALQPQRLPPWYEERAYVPLEDARQVPGLSTWPPAQAEQNQQLPPGVSVTPLTPASSWNQAAKRYPYGLPAVVNQLTGWNR